MKKSSVYHKRLARFADNPLPASTSVGGGRVDDWITQKKEEQARKRMSLDMIRARKQMQQQQQEGAVPELPKSAPPSLLLVLSPLPHNAELEEEQEENSENAQPRNDSPCKSSPATTTKRPSSPCPSPSPSEQRPLPPLPAEAKDTTTAAAADSSSTPSLLPPVAPAELSFFAQLSLHEAGVPTAAAADDDACISPIRRQHPQQPEEEEEGKGTLYSESFFEENTTVGEDAAATQEQLEQELEDLRAQHRALVAQDLEMRTIAQQNELKEEHVRTRLQPEKRSAQRTKLDAAHKYYALKTAFQQLQAELAEETLGEIRVQGEIIRLHLAHELEEEELNTAQEQQQLVAAAHAADAQAAAEASKPLVVRRRSWWQRLLMCGSGGDVPLSTTTTATASSYHPASISSLQVPEAATRRSATERQLVRDLDTLLDANRAQNSNVDADLAAEDTYFSTLTDELLRKEAKRVQTKSEFLLNNTINLADECAASAAKQQQQRRDVENTMLMLSVIHEHDNNNNTSSSVALLAPAGADAVLPTTLFYAYEQNSVVQEASV